MEQDSKMMLPKCNELLKQILPQDKLSVIGYFRQYALRDNNINVPLSIINYCILFCDLMYKNITYTWINCDISHSHYPTIYCISVPKNTMITILKQFVATIHSVNKNDLFVCDIWKSKIHIELRAEDSVQDINEKSDDIFIYNCKDPVVDNCTGKTITGMRFDRSFYDTLDLLEVQTLKVCNQCRVPARTLTQYLGQQRHEDCPIGYPLLITLPMKTKVTVNQIRNKLWGLIQPFLHNKMLTLNDELPFEMWAAWGFNNHQKLIDSDDIFDFRENWLHDRERSRYKRNLKFFIHWTDSTQYQSELYDIQNRIRHKSAQ